MGWEVLSAKEWIWNKLDTNVTSFSGLMSGFCHIMQSKKMRPDLDLKYFFWQIYCVRDRGISAAPGRCSWLAGTRGAVCQDSILSPSTIRPHCSSSQLVRGGTKNLQLSLAFCIFHWFLWEIRKMSWKMGLKFDRGNPQYLKLEVNVANIIEIKWVSVSQSTMKA